jgi:hypothetical protein
MAIFLQPSVLRDGCVSCQIRRMTIPDRIEQARRQGIGAALLLLPENAPARAYVILKQLGLCIADLQEVGFTETDVEALKVGWREMQKRIEATGFEEPSTSYTSH